MDELTGKHGLSRRKLASKISQDTDIRVDVVEEVLVSFTGIMIEELVNKGFFKMRSLFTIEGKQWGETKTLNGDIIPSRKRFTVKLSPYLKDLYKLKQQTPEIKINKDNWQKIAREKYNKNS